MSTTENLSLPQQEADDLVVPPSPTSSATSEPNLSDVSSLSDDEDGFELVSNGSSSVQSGSRNGSVRDEDEDNRSEISGRNDEEDSDGDWDEVGLMRSDVIGEDGQLEAGGGTPTVMRSKVALDDSLVNVDNGSDSEIKTPELSRVIRRRTIENVMNLVLPDPLAENLSRSSLLDLHDPGSPSEPKMVVPVPETVKGIKAIEEEDGKVVEELGFGSTYDSVRERKLRKSINGNSSESLVSVDVVGKNEAEENVKLPEYFVPVEFHSSEEKDGEKTQVAEQKAEEDNKVEESGEESEKASQTGSAILVSDPAEIGTGGDLRLVEDYIPLENVQVIDARVEKEKVSEEFVEVQSPLGDEIEAEDEEDLDLIKPTFLRKSRRNSFLLSDTQLTFFQSFAEKYLKIAIGGPTLLLLITVLATFIPIINLNMNGGNSIKHATVPTSAATVFSPQMFGIMEASRTGMGNVAYVTSKSGARSGEKKVKDVVIPEMFRTNTDSQIGDVSSANEAAQETTYHSYQSKGKGTTREHPYLTEKDLVNCQCPSGSDRDLYMACKNCLVEASRGKENELEICPSTSSDSDKPKHSTLEAGRTYHSISCGPSCQHVDLHESNSESSFINNHPTTTNDLLQVASKSDLTKSIADLLSEILSHRALAISSEFRTLINEFLVPALEALLREIQQLTVNAQLKWVELELKATELRAWAEYALKKASDSLRKSGRGTGKSLKKLAKELNKRGQSYVKMFDDESAGWKILEGVRHDVEKAILDISKEIEGQSKDVLNVLQKKSTRLWKNIEKKLERKLESVLKENGLIRAKRNLGRSRTSIRVQTI